MKIEDILFQNGHIWQGFFIVLKATVEHSRDDQHQQHQILEELLFFSFVFLWLVVFLGKETSLGKGDKPRCWCCENYGGGLMMDGRLSLKNIKIFLRCSDVWRLVTRQSPVSMFMSPSDFAHKHDATHKSSFALSSTNVVRQTYSFGQRSCPWDIRNTRHKMQGKY